MRDSYRNNIFPTLFIEKKPSILELYFFSKQKKKIRNIHTYIDRRYIYLYVFTNSSTINHNRNYVTRTTVTIVVIITTQSKKYLSTHLHRRIDDQPQTSFITTTPVTTTTQPKTSATRNSTADSNRRSQEKPNLNNVFSHDRHVREKAKAEIHTESIHGRYAREPRRYLLRCQTARNTRHGYGNVVR